MTNQNNTAQAAMQQAVRNAIRKAYDDGYNDAKMAPDNCSSYCGQRAEREGTAALLSKLHATVADELAAFKKCHAAIIKAISSIARADGPDTRKEDGPELLYRSPVMDEVVRIRGALDECSAALESAPVAGAAQPVAWENFPAYLIDHCEGDTITEEGIQRALSNMLIDQKYAAPHSSPAADGRDAAAKNVGLPDVLDAALNNLLHDNYERSYSGGKNREADVALIRAAIAAQQGEGGWV